MHVGTLLSLETRSPPRLSSSMSAPRGTLCPDERGCHCFVFGCVARRVLSLLVACAPNGCAGTLFQSLHVFSHSHLTSHSLLTPQQLVHSLTLSSHSSSTSPVSRPFLSSPTHPLLTTCIVWRCVLFPSCDQQLHPPADHSTPDSFCIRNQWTKMMSGLLHKNTLVPTSYPLHRGDRATVQDDRAKAAGCDPGDEARGRGATKPHATAEGRPVLTSFLL